MQKRRTSFYIYLAVLAVLTLALSAYRSVALMRSVSECDSVKVFSDGFYTSHTVYKISIPVFAVISALALIFAKGKKTVTFSPAEGKGSRIAALICGIGFAVCGVMMLIGLIPEMSTGGFGLFNFARLVCALLTIPCAIYFINVYAGFLREGKIWIFALSLPVWATLMIVTEYFDTYFAFNNPLRVSGNVAFAAVILFMLFEARANLAYPCGRFYMAILAALPCMAALHIIPILAALPGILGCGLEFFSFELLSDVIFLPLLAYMAARSVSSLLRIAEK